MAHPHNLTHTPADPTCWVCSRAKLTAAWQTPTSLSVDWAEHAMVRGHADIVGPTDPALIDGATYLLVTMDEGTEYVKVGAIRDKQPRTVRDMFVSIWGGERVSFTVLRTDNGGEFQAEFDEYLRERGTHHEWALADRPSTNARIEGLNRRIIEAAAAAMLLLPR